MDKGMWLRRGLHMTAPLYLLYYLVPDHPIEGVHKGYGVIVVLGAVALVETCRLLYGWDIPGMRVYEKNRPSALAWGSFGIGIGLLLFPYYFVAPTVICMGLLDPAAGWIKANRDEALRLSFLFMSGLAIYLICLALFNVHTLYLVLTFSLVGGIVIMALEGQNLGYLDDDLLMVVGPLMALGLLEQLIVNVL